MIPGGPAQSEANVASGRSHPLASEMFAVKGKPLLSSLSCTDFFFVAVAPHFVVGAFLVAACLFFSSCLEQLNTFPL